MSETEVDIANDLPEGWAYGQVSDLVKLVNGFAFKPSHWKADGLPIVRIQNLNNPDAPFNYCPDAIPEKHRVRNGNLLFAWSGTPGTSFGAHVWRGSDAWLNQHIFRVEFDEDLLDKQFLRLAINRNLDTYISQAHGGVGLAHITKGKFDHSSLCFPPLAEQKRIVAKVEALLGRVNAARARLAKVPAMLKRFRQSVLAAACSGRLTEQWRGEHGGVESASILLASLLERRRLLWSERQANRGDGYKEPSVPDVNDFSALPDGWVYASVDSISTKVVDGVHKTPEYVDDGVPFVTVRNLTAGPGISFESLNYISERDHQKFIQRANPERGDILVTKDGTLGVVRAVRTDRIFSIFVSVAMIKPVTNQLTDYLELALASPKVQNEMVATGSGLQHIHLRDLRATCFPLPSLQEQHEIVRRVEALFKLADAIEKRVAAAAARADKLTQSILARAFRGELVPTEAELARREGRDYEPASVLLERIRAEREATGERPRARRQPKPGRAQARPAAVEPEPEAGDVEQPTLFDGLESGQTGEAPVPIDQTDRDEVMAVIRDVFGSGGPRGRDQAIHEVARALGYERVGSHIREVLDKDIRTAVRRGILDNGPEGLSLLARSIEAYTRNHLIEMLLAGMGGAWWDRDELIALTGRWLGFRRTGSKIRQALKSAINGAIRRGLLESDGPRVRRVSG